MKCDVCYTTIPSGEARCPNCGMVMRKDLSASITKEPKTIQSNIPRVKVNKTYTTKKKAPKMAIASLFSVLAAIIVAVTGLIGIFDESITMDINTGYNIEVYENYAQTRIIDIEHLGFIISEDPDISIYNDNMCDIEIYAIKDDIAFTISYTLEDSDIISTSLDISGQYSGTDELSYLYMNEEDIDKLGTYLGISDLYTLFKDAYSNLETTGDENIEKYYSGYLGGYEIYIDELIDTSTNSTLFNYQIVN